MLNNRPGKLMAALASALVCSALLFNLLIHAFFITEKGPKVDCSSFFLVQSDLQTKGVMSLFIDGKDRGKMNISATVRDDAGNIKYHILRDISFEYRHEDNGYLAMQLVDIRKKASDNMPNDLFNQSIFDFSANKRHMRITEVGDSFLLWNDFSPVMMCNRSQ